MADGLLSLFQRGLLMLCLWCVVQNGLGVACRGTSSQDAIARLQSKTCAGSHVDQDGHVQTDRRPARCYHLRVGTWCSGITSASHAEGPGFNPQCVHWMYDLPQRLSLIHI